MVVIFQGEIDDHAYQLGRWISNLSSSPAENLLDHDGLPPALSYQLIFLLSLNLPEGSSGSIQI